MYACVCVCVHAHECVHMYIMLEQVVRDYLSDMRTREKISDVTEEQASQYLEKVSQAQRPRCRSLRDERTAERPVCMAKVNEQQEEEEMTSKV